ncbi:MAG: lytic transglycosylase domain-containing protein [Spirochaetia bacterium]|nr:lytic transglycosylase domain-containing protein [Spirochaetia bacterium]
MKSVKKYKKIRPIIVNLFIFTFLIFSIGAENIHEKIKLADIKGFKDILKLKRVQDEKQIKKYILEKENINYAEAYLKANILKKEKKILPAIAWFMKAAFLEPNKIPESKSIFRIYRTIITKHETGAVKSPLFTNAIYEICVLLYDSSELDYAKKFLSLIPENSMDKVLKIKILFLEALLSSKENKQEAVEKFEALLKIEIKDQYLIKYAFLLETEKNYKEALNIYFKVFDLSKSDWSYIEATKRINIILEHNNHLKNDLTDIQSIKLAEGFRLMKKRNIAANWFKLIKKEELSEDSYFIYAKNYIKLLIDNKNFDNALTEIKNSSDKLSKEKFLELLDDSAEKLYAEGAYHSILRIVPPDCKSQKAMLVRLKVLTQNFQEGQEKEAGYYLENFDKDSEISETVYFNVCLGYLINSDLSKAEDCLSNLRKITTNATSGGRSRYFLARLTEEKKDINKAIEYYESVYLNSPDSAYVFASLDKLKEYNKTSSKELPHDETGSKSVLKYQEWVLKNGSDDELVKNFFLKKKEKKGYGIDPFWIQWEKDLEILNENSSEEIKKGALFLAMGLNEEAVEYLEAVVTLPERFLISQKTGLLTEDTFLKYAYLKTYLRMINKQADLFLLSPLAAEFLYPVPYREEVKNFSKKFNMDEAQIYALMKQESSFNPSAVSRSGAKGLMQLMPKTAVWLNKTIKIQKLNLFNPAHSIWLGVKYYADLNKRLDNSFEKTAIAYNAGPGRLKQWEKEFQDNNGELFLEWIPFRETNHYVKITRLFYEGYKLFINTYYE